MAIMKGVANGASSSGSELHKRPTWWKEAVVYQIYPASFCDSNGDGIGDLQGIKSKVPYLKSLGVDVVWLSPIYRSPQNDMGYDISDYRDIHPPYGTLNDWKELKAELKKAGIRIIMDLVTNHTSDEHEWFVESRKSKDNDKRSWYYWQPPKYDEQGNRHPPNNWRSFFGAESAWEFDETTGEYYLRLFTKQQPDLNWENAEVRQAIQDIVTFWLEHGIDGFRIDAINYIAKSPGFPNAEIVEPSASHQPAMDLYLNRPKCHEFLCELGKKVLYNYDIMTVGETPHVEDPDMALQFVHPDRKEFCMIFPWEHMDVDRMPGTVIGWRPWALTSFKGIINKWQTTMQERGGWNSLYMENHDQGRSISRFGSDKPEFRWLSGKLLAMFLATLSGTLYIFQGQEIGMTNLPSEWGIEEYTDVVSQMHFKQEKQKKIQAKGCSNPDMKNVMTDIHRRGRDHGRSPMQWSGGLPNAGFTTGTPWRKTNPDFTACNVESAAKDSESVLSFWKKLVGLRKTWKTLVYGDFELVQPQDEHLFAYRRTLQGGKDSFILLNFSEKALHLDASLVPAVLGGEFVLGNYQTAGESNILRPWEARLFAIGGASY